MKYFLPKTSGLDLQHKVGQLFMPAAFINDTEEEIQKLEILIREHHIGGLCFFHSRLSAATNFEGPKKITYNAESLQTLRHLIERYQAAAAIPLLISIDAEWGLAMRIEETPQYPYALTLGAIRNNGELLFQVGKAIGRDCAAQGIHWNFAPVVDINNNPANPVIGYRSFGELANEVSEKSAAVMRGMQAGGVLTSAKHFPGHGDTATDSHLGLPLIDASLDTLEKREFVPFRKLISQGVDSVMVGHLAVPALTGDPALPATVSSKMIQGVLREELGFKGVVVSDALNMHAVSKQYPVKGSLEYAAFKAGNDVLCFAENIAEGISMIMDQADPADIDSSFKRVWNLKEQAFKQGPDIYELPGDPTPLNKAIASASLTLYNGDEQMLKEARNGGYYGLEIAMEAGQSFFKALEPTPEALIHCDPRSTLPELNFPDQARPVVMALYPPKVKPLDNFDFSKQVLQAVNTVLEKHHVILYHFGNPYMLDLIDIFKAKATVIAYQDFQVFQTNAANHFAGLINAPGILPVTLKNDQS